jgi:hypothetical protein
MNSHLDRGEVLHYWAARNEKDLEGAFQPVYKSFNQCDQLIDGADDQWTLGTGIYGFCQRDLSIRTRSNRDGKGK